MLETSKALDTITFKILLVKILKDATMDNQQETNKLTTKKQKPNKHQTKTKI
jgi:hypothetical protein